MPPICVHTQAAECQGMCESIVTLQSVCECFVIILTLSMCLICVNES